MNKICTLVYTNCSAYADANDIELDKILALKDIISWNEEVLKDFPGDSNSSDICDGHIDYIELCCKKSGLV
jgi:hypothetical protein